MYSDITGIILSGGKSLRMGENKALLNLGGKKVIERVVDLMKLFFPNVILITNTPEEYLFLNIPMFEDIYKYKGPIAGIHSGLSASATEKNFVISCDIPMMTSEMIKYIVEFKTEKPITVCRADGFIQHLVGKYSKSVLPVAEKLLVDYDNTESRNQKQNKRHCKMLPLLDKAGAEIIDAEQLSFYNEHLFFNMNRPDDYKKILEQIIHL